MKNKSPQVRKARALANLRRATRASRLRVYQGRRLAALGWMYPGSVYDRRADPLTWPVFAPQPGDVEDEPFERPF